MAEELEYGEEGGILTAIKEGMSVYDVEGEEVGEVDFVYFGTMQIEDTALGVTPATQGTAPGDLSPGESWVARLNDILGLDDPDLFPEVVAKRLMQKGFVRVEGGLLFGDDRFILPEQIAGLDEDGVHLKVEADDLAEDW